MSTQSPTFAGTRAFSYSDLAARVALIGVPSSAGSPTAGAELAPDYVRRLSGQFTWSTLRPAVLNASDLCLALAGVTDFGDLDVRDRSASQVAQVTADAVRSLPEAVRPLIIGGDHSVSAGVVKAISERCSGQRLKIVQFDSHLDLQTWESSSQCGGVDRLFHTNVMSHALRMVGRDGLRQIGGSPFIGVEEETGGSLAVMLENSGQRLDAVDAANCSQSRYRQFLGGRCKAYVTIDVDVLVEAQMATTPYPATIGISMARLLHLVRETFRHLDVIGADVVEYSPVKGVRDARTLADGARVSLIVALLAGSLSNAIKNVRPKR
jgi:arginase family enzyme